MTPAVYAIRDLAGLFGEHPKTTRRKLPALYRAGFPKPLPGPGHRKWAAGPVDRWLGRAVDPDAPIAELPAGVTDFNSAAEILRQRTARAAA